MLISSPKNIIEKYEYLFSSHLTGFLRFLTIIANHDWENDPLIVDLNETLTGLYDLSFFNIHHLVAILKSLSKALRCTTSCK